MASSSSSTGFTIGKLTQQIQDWYNDPSNSKNPLKSYLECLPNNEYTNAEFQSIELNLNQIKQESLLFESKRIYNEVNNLLEQLDTIKCLGEDSTFLFANFVEYCKNFIEFYEQIQEFIPLESSVNQNPNYYNN